MKSGAVCSFLLASVPNQQSMANQNNNHHQLLFHLIYLIFSCKTQYSPIQSPLRWNFDRPLTSSVTPKGWLAGWLQCNAMLVLNKNRTSPQIVSNYSTDATSSRCYSVYFSVRKWDLMQLGCSPFVSAVPFPGCRCNKTPSNGIPASPAVVPRGANWVENLSYLLLV